MSGYKVVPVEPTAEMVEAFKAMWSLGFCDDRMAKECYAAIMDAAPDVHGEPVAEEVTLLECVSCNHLYQGQVTQCDCMPDEQKFNRWLARPERAVQQPSPSAPTFHLGDHVRKTKGSQWKGRVVGTYSTSLTPEGYAVESDTEKGSVQIYPVGALELVGEDAQKPAPDVSKLVEALELISDTDPNEGTAWFHEIAYKALTAHRKQGGGHV